MFDLIRNQWPSLEEWKQTFDSMFPSNSSSKQFLMILLANKCDQITLSKSSIPSMIQSGPFLANFGYLDAYVTSARDNIAIDTAFNKLLTAIAPPRGPVAVPAPAPALPLSAYPAAASPAPALAVGLFESNFSFTPAASPSALVPLLTPPRRQWCLRCWNSRQSLISRN